MAAIYHPVFEHPKNMEIAIWRYMDFTKLVSMLLYEGLYFSRLDQLGDPFEGSLPKASCIDHPSQFPPEITNNPQLLAAIMEGRKNSRAFVRLCRSRGFVSAWHMAEHESAAMWKLYAKTEEAVCIQSRFCRLNDLLPTQFMFGMVRYIDYEKETVPEDNMLWPFAHKRKSFEHEREVRALIMNLADVVQQPDPPAELGRWVNMDLRALIERVYVAPTAPDWFKDNVEATIRRFGFGLHVVRSSLDDSPLW